MVAARQRMAVVRPGAPTGASMAKAICPAPWDAAQERLSERRADDDVQLP